MARKSNRVTFLDFGKNLAMATKDLEPGAIKGALARFARQSLKETIDSGLGSPNYRTYVNGQEGLAEENVKLPGPIVYQFVWWRPIIGFAIEALEAGSPVRSGRYRGSWLVMVNGYFISDSGWGDIDPRDEVIIVNTQPYHRKIETGHMTTDGERLLVYRTRRAVAGRFNEVVESKYIQARIPNPYILKGRFSRGKRAKSRTKLRIDTQAGAAMTYPAISLRMRNN